MIDKAEQHTIAVQQELQRLSNHMKQDDLVIEAACTLLKQDDLAIKAACKLFLRAIAVLPAGALRDDIEKWLGRNCA